MEKLYVSFCQYGRFKYLIQVYRAKDGRLELVETHTTKQTDDLLSDEERIIGIVRKLHPDAIVSWYGMFNEESKEKIEDKAIERGAYIEHCLNTFWHVIDHIIKICIWNDSQEVGHWRDEIYGTLNRLMKYSVKKDGKDNHIRNKAFIENFIYGYFDDDFSGYDKISDEFVDVIKKEGKLVEDYDIDGLVSSNKETIIEFLNGLAPVFELGDSTELRKYIDLI